MVCVAGLCGFGGLGLALDLCGFGWVSDLDDSVVWLRCFGVGSGGGCCSYFLRV